MATPRSRWIRVSDLVLDEDWSDATLATVIRLLAWMRQRWAREKLRPEQAIEAVIGPLDAAKITRIRRHDLALEALNSLGTRAGLATYSASTCRGLASDSVRIKWPKVAEYQGWDTREPGTNRTPDALSGDPAHGDPAHVEEEKTQKKPPPAAPAVEKDPVALSFASDFRAALGRVHEGFKPPTAAAFAGWCKQARLLLAERPEAEVRSLARWLFDTTSPSEAATFWRSVVLSVPKFREKFDQIAARRRGEEGRTNGRSHLGTVASGPGTSPLAERARAELRRLGGAGP